MNRDSVFAIFDIETDDLLEGVTKIHCLSYQKYCRGEIISKGSITDYNEIIDFFNEDIVLVGHNIIRYDIPVINKILGIEIYNEVVDTLGISWYLYPNRKKHGLEVWGIEVGVEKPLIKDWKNLTILEYIFRCESDVEININIFRLMFNYLSRIYDTFEDINKIVKYINFKLNCLKDQENEGIYLDIDKVNLHYNTLNSMFLDKFNLLSNAMPKNLGRVLKVKPKIMHKKDGTLSIHAENWYKYLEVNHLPEDTEISIELPNPGSDKQLKDWLLQLGWKPITFKLSKQTGKTIPQVSLPFGAGLCQSVKDLYDIEPNLVELENYFKIKHRIGIFKSYLKNEKNHRVKAVANGFTNTMRLTHSEPIANLPKPSVFYGKEIREVLTVENDSYIMCGSDISGLEDNTKQHYIYFFDPDYVNDMRVPGFDPHLDIGVAADLMTLEDSNLFKDYSNRKETLSEQEQSDFKRISKIRGNAKTVNFGAVYGAGPAKIAETIKCDFNFAKTLHTAYWKRNSAVKKIANLCYVKTVENQKWLYNPISGFYMFLKADKDKFSTLNQSSGVYVFDTWLSNVKRLIEPIGNVVLQYHDEILLVCKKESKHFIEEKLKESMKIANDTLKLNVEIGISIDFGNNYAECH